MNIAVICAMRDELDAILHTLDQKIIREESVLHNSVYVADYNGNNLYLCLSGIGKVNSAIMTQKIIDTYQINYVLNIGVAGALSDELTFGDIVIANDLVEHDVDATAFGLAKGQIPRMDILLQMLRL